MSTDFNWLVKVWRAAGSAAHGDEATSRRDAVRAAAVDAAETIEPIDGPCLLTAHHADSDVTLGWAVAYPGTASKIDAESVHSNPRASDRTLHAPGEVVIRFWSLLQVGRVDEEPDREKAWHIAGDVAGAFRDDRAEEEFFVTVEYPDEEVPVGVDWYRPAHESEDDQPES